MPTRTSGESRSTDEVFLALIVAIRERHVTKLQELLTTRWAKGDHRNASLFEAGVKSRQPEVVSCLLQNGVVPDRESPIFSAIREVEALKAVLAKGYSVDVTSSAEKRPLHVAVTLNAAAIPALLSAGCDVTARDGVHGNTPLHSACSHSEDGAILQLLRAGARANALNCREETPLHCLLKHACDPRGSFHAKSRQSLARCLIHVGMVVTSPRPDRTDCRGRGGEYVRRGGMRSYKIDRVYRQLLGETRRSVSSLLHLCRLRVRELCEGDEAWPPGGAGEGGAGARGGGERSLAQLVEELEVSRHLKEYLLYKDHVFDRGAFSCHTTTTGLLPS